MCIPASNQTFAQVLGEKARQKTKRAQYKTRNSKVKKKEERQDYYCNAVDDTRRSPQVLDEMTECIAKNQDDSTIP